MDSNKYTTPVFRVPASKYLKLSLSNAISPITVSVITAVYIAIACIAGYQDIRFGLVALMLLLIVCPALLAIFILARMFTPEAVRGSIPHTATIDDEGSVDITYENDDELQYVLPPNEHIKSSEIAEIKRSGGYMVIKTTSGKLVILPAEGIEFPDSLKERLSSFD